MFGWVLNTPLILYDLHVKSVRQHQADGRWTSTSKIFLKKQK